MNLQELESIARIPEPSLPAGPKMFPLQPVVAPALKALPPGPRWVSSVLDTKGHEINRYEEPDGSASLMITSKDHPIITQDEINEVEAWYWNSIGVKGGVKLRDV